MADLAITLMNLDTFDVMACCIGIFLMVWGVRRVMRVRKSVAISGRSRNNKQIGE